MSGEHKGRIVAAYGRHYVVELADGKRRQCYPRGKKTGLVVGDWVQISPQGHEEGAIETILPRRNLLYRCDAMRSKQFAANIDQLLIVVAVEPPFSEDLAGRALTAAWSIGIEPVLVLNKTDLTQGLFAARQRLAGIAALGIPILELSAKDTCMVAQQLTPRLAGRTSLLLGQSGMGKSTLLNALVPEAAAPTQAHSAALNMGKHTTTSTRLYHLPCNGALIDSPGFQAFGLQHLSHTELLQGFPEFVPYVKQCRFYNCTHRHEPDCGVLAAMRTGKIAQARHQLYERIFEENEAAHSRYKVSY